MSRHVMAALASGPYADSGVALADLCLHYSCYEYSLIYTHDMFLHPLCFRKTPVPDLAGGQ